MNCQFIYENVIAFLENQLSKDDMIKYQAHLGECPTCREAVEEIKLTYALAVRPPDLSVSDDFVDNTMARMYKQESRVVPLVFQMLKPVAVAASIALGIIIGNGELVVLENSTYSEEEALVYSATASTDYSVWQSIDENYGNEN